MPNIPENINNLLQEFIVGVQDILGEHLIKIILYGSYARGDFCENSDVDIMILTDLNDKELENVETQIWNFAYDIEYNNNFNIDLSPRIRNVDQFNERIKVIPFYMNVQKEGVVLNG